MLFRSSLRCGQYKLSESNTQVLADKMILRGKSTNDYTEYLIQAEKEFVKAVSADPGYALAHFNLANVYLDLDDIPKAQKHLSRAEELGISDQKCNLLRSSILIQQKMFDEAQMPKLQEYTDIFILT